MSLVPCSTVVARSSMAVLARVRPQTLSAGWRTVRRTPLASPGSPPRYLPPSVFHRHYNTGSNYSHTRITQKEERDTAFSYGYDCAIIELMMVGTFGVLEYLGYDVYTYETAKAKTREEETLRRTIREEIRGGKY